jgi:hypothetical protein
MSRVLATAFSALVIASLACSFNLNVPDIGQVETGPEQTVTVAEPAPEAAEVVDVELEMGAGELDLRADCWKAKSATTWPTGSRPSPTRATR